MIKMLLSLCCACCLTLWAAALSSSLRTSERALSVYDGVPADSLTLEQAQEKLTELNRRLRRVDIETDEEAEREIARQVNTSPKGEYETTKEFEARQHRADELRAEITARFEREKLARRVSLNRQVSEILATEFTMKVAQAWVGIYDADSEQLPFRLYPAPDLVSLRVARAEARELKENFSRAEKRGTFALLVDAENRVRPYLLSAEVAYDGHTYRTASHAPDAERAMRMLYGNYDAAKKSSLWQGDIYLLEENGVVSETEGETFSATPLLFKPFREEGANKLFLLTATIPEGGDCHACGAHIGMAVLTERGPYWKIEAAQKVVGQYGAYGQPPTPELVRLGPDRFGLTFSWGDMHQGIAEEGVIFIDRDGGIFREILSIETATDTSGYGTFATAEDNAFYESKIDYLPGSHPTYFDIRVTTRGRRGARLKRRLVMRPFVKVQLYRFSGDSYKPVPSSAALAR